MPFKSIIKGLTIKIPTRRTTDWDSTLETELWEKLSEHDHTGSGKGNQIPTGGIANNAADDLAIRLRNAQWLRSRNAADTGDVNLIRANASDQVEVPVTIAPTAGTTYTNEPGAAPTIGVGKTYFQPNYVIGSALTVTVAAGEYMEILGFLKVDGTLIANGNVRVS